jgi:lysophospholipase L1-like esterase
MRTGLLALFAVMLTCNAAVPPKKKVVRPAPVSAAARAAARREIEEKITAVRETFENPQALTGFFEALKQSRITGAPVHVLQFGDSHTASDDWVNAMRIPAQGKYGDGGPGFIQAGRPYRGYRRYDASGNNSLGWKTEGTMGALRGDADQGLSGVSISTARAGQTVTLKASGQLIEIYYFQQPGGGQLQLEADGQIVGSFPTDGDSGPGIYSQALLPGLHEFTLRTLDAAPVRLYGWTVDNTSGVTLETLGINGAQANVVLGWNEQIWSAAVGRRNPALVTVAYGTNEANSHTWTPEQYRDDLTAVVDRIRRAAPAASILLVGPLDCGKLRPLLHLSEVNAIQRELASRLGVAFWDWRMHMGGPGIMKRWVTAGLAQNDYIHLTGEGYRMIGALLFDQLEAASGNSHE